MSVGLPMLTECACLNVRLRALSCGVAVQLCAQCPFVCVAGVESARLSLTPVSPCRTHPYGRTIAHSRPHQCSDRIAYFAPLDPEQHALNRRCAEEDKTTTLPSSACSVMPAGRVFDMAQIRVGSTAVVFRCPSLAGPSLGRPMPALLTPSRAKHFRFSSTKGFAPNPTGFPVVAPTNQVQLQAQGPGSFL